MTRILTCIFSYQQYDLLRNVANSVERFFPWGDRVIFDDCSPDPRIRAFIEQKARSERWRYRVSDSRRDTRFGGFYRNMEQAIAMALDEGYDICALVEDDQQFVWQKPEYPAYIARVFDSCPDAILLQNLLLMRLLPFRRNLYTEKPAIEFIEDVQAYRTERGFNSCGFVNLHALRRSGNFDMLIAQSGSSLSLNSGRWLSRGWRVYQEFAPTMTHLPWVRTSRYEQTNETIGADGAVGHGSDDLILNPLTQDQIDFLTTRDPETIARQEYFALAPNNIRRPVWYLQGYNIPRYFHLCRRTFEIEAAHGLSLPLLKTWRPTRIPPFANHVKAYEDYLAEHESPSSTVAPSAARRPDGEHGWFRTWLKSVLPGPVVNAIVRIVNGFWDLRFALQRAHRYSLRDYIGYLRLAANLREEQKRLPYDLFRLCVPRPRSASKDG